MSKQSVPVVVEPSVPSPKARRFTDEFKRDSVRVATLRSREWCKTISAVRDNDWNTA